MPESETPQTGDADGQDPDKPPHVTLPPSPIAPPAIHGANVKSNAPIPSSTPAAKSPERRPSSNLSNGVKRMFANNIKTPAHAGPLVPPTLPPPVVHKIRPGLGQFDVPNPRSGVNTGTNTPSTTDSPSASDSDWGPSPPSTRPPSRAVSVSRSDGGHGKDLAASEHTIHPIPPSRASSIKSSDGEGRFTLKDLLGSGPKLARKSSGRSSGGSSRKSDSSTDTASLLRKYGVCERVAIGKGATSVVRLAHKWDRTEEKLYAVKVCFYAILHAFLKHFCRNSGKDGKMRLRKNTSRNLQPSSVYPQRCTTLISSRQ